MSKLRRKWNVVNTVPGFQLKYQTWLKLANGVRTRWRRKEKKNALQHRHEADTPYATHNHNKEKNKVEVMSIIFVIASRVFFFHQHLQFAFLKTPKLFFCLLFQTINISSKEMVPVSFHLMPLFLKTSRLQHVYEMAWQIK